MVLKLVTSGCVNRAGSVFLQVRRWEATSAKKKTKNDASKQKYTATILLPKTDFPQRVSDGKARQDLDAKLRESSSMHTLYDWQRSKRNNNDSCFSLLNSLQTPAAGTGQEFILHDGPPYANGDVHVGHAVNKILKDITNRYKLLRGFRVDYRPGWDCHGLPIELKALEKLGSSAENSGQAIREAAKSIVRECSRKQMLAFSSWGVMANWSGKDIYRTTDRSYEAKQIELFWRLYDRGLIYRELKPVYWSPSSQSSLAEAELEYNNGHQSTAIYAGFKISQRPEHLKRLLPSEYRDVEWSALIWTTTPWTIPANEAIAFNPNMKYVLAPSSNDGSKIVYIFAESELEKIRRETDIQFLSDVFPFSGDQLSSVKYSHPWVSSRPVCPFLPASYVTPGKGSGLVHTAPAHGQDDYLLGLKHGLNCSTCLVDTFGKFTKDAGSDLEGKEVLSDGTKTVMDILNSQGQLLGQSKFSHPYPYDWRTKRPVILRASEQWFIDVEKIREPALAALDQVEMIPKSGKDIMVAQLKSRPYWCISRQRTWGVPIPVFYAADGRPLVDKESTDHIGKLFSVNGADAWWDMSDDVLLPDHVRSSLGLEPTENVTKGTDILDIWFESGTSWAAVLGEDKVADLYVEGSDQYGAWFQTSLLTSVALRGTAPFKRVFVHGFALDEKGRKMSKSVGNVVHPDAVTQKYGVDVLRWWVAQSVNGSGNLSVGPNVLEECKETLNKLRNTFRFLVGACAFPPTARSVVDDATLHSSLLVDRYMTSMGQEFIEKARDHYDNMEFNKLTQEIVKFVAGDLMSFYLTAIKDRLYCNARNSPERWSALKTLNAILSNLCYAVAPVAPFLAEEVWSHGLGDKRRFSGVTRPFFEAMAGSWRDRNAVEDEARAKDQHFESLNLATFPAILRIRDRLNQVCASRNTAQLQMKLYIGGEALAKYVEALEKGQLSTRNYYSELPDIFGVSEVHVAPWPPGEGVADNEHTGEVFMNLEPDGGEKEETQLFKFSMEPATARQCGRCRRYCVTEAVEELCPRCRDVMAGLEAPK